MKAAKVRLTAAGMDRGRIRDFNSNPTGGRPKECLTRIVSTAQRDAEYKAELAVDPHPRHWKHSGECRSEVAASFDRDIRLDWYGSVTPIATLGTAASPRIERITQDCGPNVAATPVNGSGRDHAKPRSAFPRARARSGSSNS